MAKRCYPALFLFTVVFLLQGNWTWQLEDDPTDALPRSQRGERYSPGFCHDGWYTFGEMCYFISTDKRSWEKADKECTTMKSNLVSIHNQEQQDFLTMLLFEATSETWVGLRRANSGSNVFEWEDSSPLNFTNWAEGEPNNYHGEEKCVHMHYGHYDVGQWNDATCTARNSYICQARKDPTLTTPGRDPGMCTVKKGWLKMRNSCYKVFHRTDSFSSWSKAQSLCKSYGGNLAYVKNPAVNMLLHINTKGLEGPFWTGIKSTKRQKYTWLGKKHPLMFSNWQTDQPKETSDKENCVAVDTEGKWIPRDCGESHPFICEIGPELPEAPTLEPFGENMTCSYTSQKWHDIGGKYCYIIELTSKLKWREALCRCREEGGSVASLHSREETTVILHYVNHHDMPQKSLFIGLVRDQKGRFGWSDGSAWDYVNWAYGEPNDYVEQCAEIDTRNGRWNDVHCNNKLGFVCSTPKVPQRQISVSDAEKPVSRSQTAEPIGESMHLSTGNIVVITISSLLVAAAVFGISVFCVSRKTKFLDGSPYSGLE